MDSNEENQKEMHERLSGVVTRSRAPQAEVCRYVGPVYRYFMSIVKNPAKAEELTERFVERFLNQDFQKHVDRSKGRFRDYLKTSIRNMAREFEREEQLRNKRFRPLVEQVADVAAPEPDAAVLDSQFDTACSAQWLHRAWEKLKALETTDRVPYFAVLSLKSNRPDLRSQEIAAELNQALKCDLNAGSVRKILERAREKFADVLLDEVLRSLPAAEHDRLEEELIELNLLEYCRSALKRRQDLLDENRASKSG